MPLMVQCVIAKACWEEAAPRVPGPSGYLPFNVSFPFPYLVPIKPSQAHPPRCVPLPFK